MNLYITSTIRWATVSLRRMGKCAKGENGNTPSQISLGVWHWLLTYKGVFNFMDGANEEIEYEYDKNGNLVKDLNKNISKIEYNLLNLPSKITFGDGKTITYVYDASGAKLLASYQTALPASSHTIAYCGNMIYEDDTFKQVLFDGGYITFTDNRAMYHYYLKDHLGNNRVVVSSKGEVEQVTHYYPYGGIMAESTSESVQRYKYNGKELDRMHGLECRKNRL